MTDAKRPKIVPDTEYGVRFLSSWTYRTDAFHIADRLVAEDITDRDTILKITGNDEILTELVSFLARSRRFVLTISDALRIGVVFAVWKEVRRLQPHSPENPAGEDGLRAKVAELEWLFRDTPVTWSIYVVDDECPEGSLDVAQVIVDQAGWKNVFLLRLRDALPASDLPLSKLDSASSSTKGGAILLGMQRAAQDGHDYVMYTDCDNSNNLGQIGLFLRELIGNGNKAAIGDRRATHISEWHTTRESESYANYIIKRVHALLDFDLLLGDVTCPFKMFEREYLLALLERMDVFDFCVDFDIVGYLKTSRVPVAIVPIVSVDSDLETTWIALTNVKVWWQKLHGFIYVIEKYDLPHNAQAAALVRERLWTSENIRHVLEVAGDGITVNGRLLTIEDQLQMPFDQVNDWIRSALARPRGQAGAEGA
ncbi:glycosyl transferase family 2 [Rhizobium sp. PP-F2F-G48]|uniref:glycosyltransferase n=1 Tax=Rhizobium sp. PP-F2F-G48 TaxID=2135651 RepID=UPI0010476105|nr:glycosyltransferase [Rhizobium sp. PP-F2F-G48]TCM51089.1 glycosyl transferase family 2 [Rhizobium sp. PP-F2F-G48]